MNSLRGISAVVVKELKQLLRSRALVALIVLYPFFAALIIPRIYCFDLKNVRMAVVDSDNSALSSVLTESLDCSDMLTLCGVCGSYEEAFELMEKGLVDCIAVFPEGLEGSILAGDVKKVQLSMKAVDVTKGILGTKLVKASLLTAVSKYFGQQGVELRPDTGLISEMNLYNPTMDYLLFMIPVILLSVAFAVCSNVTVNSMTSEMSSGVLEIMNASPIRPWALVASKIIACYIAGLAATVISLSISYVAYGMPQWGSLGLIFLFFSIYLLGLPAFAIFLGNISTSHMQAFFLIVIFLTVSQYMSGFLTPAESMVEWMQKVNVVNPAYYLVVVLRSIYLKGASLADLLRPLAIMVLQCAGLWALAIFTFRKRHA